jgi:hypothetical protein
MMVKVAPKSEPTLDTEFSVVVRWATNHRFTLSSRVPIGPLASHFVRIRPEPDEESSHHHEADEHDETASNDRTMCSQTRAEVVRPASGLGSRTPEGLRTAEICMPVDEIGR